MKTWEPPKHWLKITTIDAHTGGEPFRVITSGYPDLPGETILARRRYARDCGAPGVIDDGGRFLLFGLVLCQAGRVWGVVAVGWLALSLPLAAYSLSWPGGHVCAHPPRSKSCYPRVRATRVWGRPWPDILFFPLLLHG